MMRLWVHILVLIMVLVPELKAEALSGVPAAFGPWSIAGRGEGMAGAQTARPAPGEAVIYNPASATDVNKWSAAYYYNNQFTLLTYHYISFLYRPDSSANVWGASVIENGDEVYREGELNLTWSRDFWQLLWGANVKLRYAGTGSGGTDFINPDGDNTRVEGTGYGVWGLDLGITLPMWENRLRLSMVLKDLFSAILWNTENEAGTAKGEYWEFVPYSMRFGGSYLPLNWLELNIDIEPSFYTDGKNRISTSMEVKPLYFLEDEILKQSVLLRTGFRQNIMDSEPSRVFAFGLGLQYKTAEYCFTLDGAYSINTIFKGYNTPKVGLSIRM
jgi:hypothetical protein